MTTTAAAREPSRIVRVETYAVAVPLQRPPADAHASLTHWTVPVVEITTEDGVVGTGISGVHTGADLLCDVIDRYYAPLLLGADARLVRRLWHALVTSPVQWIGRAGTTHMSLAMCDMALWDGAARRAGMPLWELLGGHHQTLRTYNTDGGWLNRSIDELQRDLAACVASGWTGVKMKVGSPRWRDDVERVRAAREAVGPDVDLMCDANKVWDLDTARRLLPYFEAVEMSWIEEPLHPDDIEGHRMLQSQTRIPIAVGESLYSRFAFRDYIKADAARLLQVDVTRVGGVTEYLEVASHAGVAGLAVIPHAGDMMVVHQHLAAAAFATAPASIEYLPWTLDAFATPVQVEGGHVALPTEPGASTAIHPKARREWSVPDVGSVSTR
jgi:L-alanine-DL-glutamate epimerase-like enolase superfamily enzyme